MKSNLTTGRNSALEMLHSGNFFELLRGDLGRLGLSAEAGIGVGVFVAMVSRFLPNPLRLRIEPSTVGSADYVVHRVGRLLPADTVVNVSPKLDEEWSRLENAADRKIAYVSESCREAENVRFAVRENSLFRIRSVQEEGRVAERVREIKGRFLCIATNPLAEFFQQGRWLSIKLPAPPAGATGQMPPVHHIDFAAWHEVQRLLQERAKRRVILPEFEDEVSEKISENDYSRRHIPAFRTAWKTISLLRSFLPDDAGTTGKYIHGDFAGFAATASLLRKVFREGSSFPPVRYIFTRISKPGDRTGIISPVTGTGLSYIHKEERAEFESLLPGY